MKKTLLLFGVFVALSVSGQNIRMLPFAKSFSQMRSNELIKNAALSAVSSGLLLDSIVLVDANTGVKESKEEYTYYPGKKQKEKIEYAYNGDDWEEMTKTEWDYNTAGLTTMLATYEWINNSWRGLEKIEYTYDAAGNQICGIIYQWGNVDDWEKVIKLEFKFEENDSFYVISFWNSNEWVTYLETSCEITVGENGLWTSIIAYNVDGQPAEKREFAYYENGYIKETNLYSWSKFENDWKDNWIILTYDINGTVIGETSYVWEENHWIGDYKIEISYDSYGIPQFAKSYMWKEDENDWEITEWVKIEFTSFDEQGYPAAGNVLFYTPATNSWETVFHIYACFSKSTAVRPPALPGTFKIKSSGNKLYIETDKPAYLQIYNLTGNLILQENIGAGLNVKELPQGIAIAVIDGTAQKILITR